MCTHVMVHIIIILVLLRALVDRWVFLALQKNGHMTHDRSGILVLSFFESCIQAALCAFLARICKYMCSFRVQTQESAKCSTIIHLQPNNFASA